MVLLAVGYGAGLATGLSRLMTPVFVLGYLLIVALLVWREWWFPLVPAAMVGVVVGGLVAFSAATSCAAALPVGEHDYRIRTVDPGEGTGRVELTDHRCHGAVLAHWPSAVRIPAGSTMRVTARWVPVARPMSRPDGMLLVRQVDSARGAPSPVEALRNRLVRATQALYGPRAPLVNALLAGWRGELDPDLRSAFASAGMMHLLAISGLHVGLLAAWAYLVLRLVRVPRHPAECAGAAIALSYAAFLGWPAAATRASVVLMIAAGCRWRQRQVRLGALQALSVLLVLIVEPWSIAEPGLWLSVAGVAGVVAAIRWSDQAIGTRWWVRSLSGSAGAVVTTAPLAAAIFGQVAPVGILLNVVGMPLLVALLPILLVSVVCWPLMAAVAHPAAASGSGLLALLELLVRAGAESPGSAAAGQTGWAAAVPWTGLLVAGAWIIRGNTTLPEATRRIAWSAMFASVIAFVTDRRSPAMAGDGGLTMLFADVGQGDATLIRTPLGHWIEVDAGPIGDGYDAGRRVVAPMLARLGVSRVDLFVLSHAHRDHVGGATAVLDRIPFVLAVEPGELFADSAYEGWLSTLSAHHVRWRSVKAGMHWSIDGVSFRVLHPPWPWPHQGEDLNEDSVVLELSFGTFRALMMGDAGFVAEGAMTDSARSVSVLKVGHHGSRTASGASFLAAIRPQVAIVSVGRNHYGHPAPETLDRLHAAGAQAWRTDLEGTVTVTTDGRTFSVKGARSAATFDTRH